MLTRIRTQAGVTVIELLLGLVVLGVILGIGVPSFRTWMANSQIRTAADALMNGLQLARSEAIRRNKRVEFHLADGTNWSVELVNPRTTLQERQGDEGSKNATFTVTPGGADRLTFGALGNPVANTDGSLAITAIDITAVNSAPAVRALRIQVSAAGSVRLCDPPTNSPALPTGDPRRCGP